MKRWFRVPWPIGLLTVGLLVTAVGVWSAKGTLAAQDPTLSILPNSQNVRNGDTFTVEIAVANVTELASFQFFLMFDPGILRVEGASDGGFLGSTGRDVLCQPPMTDPSGNVRVGCGTGSTSGSGDITPAPSGAGVIATVTFTAIGEGVSPLTFGPVDLTDNWGIDPGGSRTANEAAVRVVDPEDPTPTDTPPTPTRNPTAMTPTPIPGARRTNPALPGEEYQVPGGSIAAGEAMAPGGAVSGAGGASGASGGASSSGGADADGGTAGRTGGSPRAGTGPPQEGSDVWPTLASGLLATGGVALLSLAVYLRRPSRRRLL